MGAGAGHGEFLRQGTQRSQSGAIRIRITIKIRMRVGAPGVQVVTDGAGRDWWRQALARSFRPEQRSGRGQRRRLRRFPRAAAGLAHRQHALLRRPAQRHQRQRQHRRRPRARLEHSCALSIHQTMRSTVLAKNPQPCFDRLVKAGQLTKFNPQHPSRAQGATARRKPRRGSSPSTPSRLSPSPVPTTFRPVNKWLSGVVLCHTP